MISERTKAVENDLKLRDLSRKRWTARAQSIQAVWVSYEIIIESVKDVNETSIRPRTAADADSLMRKNVFIHCIIDVHEKYYVEDKFYHHIFKKKAEHH